MAGGADMDPSKCEPGGAEATADLGYAMDVYFKGPEIADKTALGTPGGGGDAVPPPADATAGEPAPAPAA
jgi:hypothetical protein